MDSNTSMLRVNKAVRGLCLSGSPCKGPCQSAKPRICDIDAGIPADFSVAPGGPFCEQPESCSANSGAGGSAPCHGTHRHIRNLKWECT